MGDGVAKMETPAFMPGRTSIFLIVFPRFVRSIEKRLGKLGRDGGVTTLSDS